MHSGQVPLSSLDETTLEPNSTNFPGAKVFFKIDESVGDTTITDCIGGITVAATITAGSDDYCKDILITPATATSSTLPTTTTNAAIYFAIEDSTAGGGCIFGSVAAGDYVSFLVSAAIDDGGTTFLPAAGFSAGKYIKATVITPGSPLNCQIIEYDGTTLTANAAAPATGVTSITPGSFMGCASDTTDTYLVGFYEFTDGIPSAAAINQGLIWMYHKAVDEGIKTLPPHWKNSD